MLFDRRSVLAAGLVPLLRAIPLNEFPLGVTTDEIDDGLERAIAFLQQFGLRHAEFRRVWGQYSTSLPLDRIREARRMLDEASIRLAILDTEFFRIPLPADTPAGRATLDNQWALLDQAIERATILGTDKLRTFAFLRGQGEEKGDPRLYPRIYELVAEGARRAAKRGFRLAIENLGASYVSTGAESAAMFHAVRERNLGLTWDPNNAGSRGERSFPDGYRLLDPARIFHVHLRDYRKNAQGVYEWCPVGQGEFDNLGQIRALLKDGYRGAWSLETHWRSPQGKEHASRTSLTALLKIIAQV